MQLDDSLDSSFEHFPLVDALDHEILMHRDAHFGGLFSVMIDYYQTEGKGVQPQFSLQRIEKLQQLEKELKRVTMERDILKEATVFFAGESKKNTRS